MVNLKQISSYIRGHYYFFLEKLSLYPEYKKEQIYYRLEQCKDDCVQTGACKECGCPTKKKMFDPVSCNRGERFPDIMNKDEWEKYKLQKGI